MLRERALGESLWEAVLPEELRELPPERGGSRGLSDRPQQRAPRPPPPDPSPKPHNCRSDRCARAHPAGRKLTPRQTARAPALLRLGPPGLASAAPATLPRVAHFSTGNTGPPFDRP